MVRSTRLFAPFIAALACACGTAASPSSPTGAPTAGAPSSTIVVLGDSLAVSPSRDRAFPAVLQRKLDEASVPWTVINRGVAGDTTSDGRARLNAALEEAPAILILELGANDGLRGVSIATIRANLSDIIARAKARGVRVLLCGMETFPTRGLTYFREFHAIFPSLAREHDVPLVPFLLLGVVGDPALNGDDLIHPNAAGAERIADNVWPYLQPLIAASSR